MSIFGAFRDLPCTSNSVMPGSMEREREGGGGNETFVVALTPKYVYDCFSSMLVP